MRMREMFPKEVTSDVPRVTLTGAERVQVEQHHGLVAYQPEEVVFRTGSGVIRICGAGLRFRLYSAGEAVLYGRIDGIEVTGAEGGGKA